MEVHTIYYKYYKYLENARNSNGLTRQRLYLTFIKNNRLANDATGYNEENLFMKIKGTFYDNPPVCICQILFGLNSD